MEQWPCRLEKVAADSPQMSHPTEALYSAGPLGTFSVQGDEVVIQYSEAMLRNPDALAATFAHELCHYLLANAGDPPGGPDLMEHSTDCAAAYLGFGVLLANSARQFEQFNDGEWQGWRASTAGYLSEQALVTATALFAALHLSCLCSIRSFGSKGTARPTGRRALWRGNRGGGCPRRRLRQILRAVIHIVFNWAWRSFHAADLLPKKLCVSIDLIFREHIAFEQEFVIRFQSFQSFAQ